MQHIETVTLDSAQSSIVLDEIPDTYTDLVILVSARGDGVGFAGNVADMRFEFNGSSADFSYRNLFGLGSSVQSNTNAHNFINGATSTANTFGNLEIHIPNYRSSSAKSFSVSGVTENNATDTRQIIAAGLWNQTAAITEIEFFSTNNNFVQHSTVSLYGILAGSDGIVAVS